MSPFNGVPDNFLQNPFQFPRSVKWLSQAFNHKIKYRTVCNHKKSN